MRYHLHLYTGDAFDGELVAGTKELAGPLYVNFPVARASEDAIAGWAASWGFNAPINPHVTVAYSRKPIKASKVPLMSAGMVIPPGGRTIERFGNSLVLCVECQALHDRHADYMKAGASYDYPSYRPHISFAYGGDDWGGRDFSHIQPFDEPITLLAEQRVPLDTDYEA